MSRTLKLPSLKINCTMIDLTKGDKRERELEIPLTEFIENDSYYIISAHDYTPNISSYEL